MYLLVCFSFFGGTLEFGYLEVFPFLGGACHVGSMGKFGSPHKLCIIRTLEFVYFSVFGGMPCVLWVNLEVPINCVFLEHWNLYVFPFLGHAMCAPWVNLEVPINCVLLEHWNLYIFPFLGSFYARAQWVNLEVPINCVLLEHWNKYIFPFLGGMPCVLHG